MGIGGRTAGCPGAPAGMLPTAGDARMPSSTFSPNPTWDEGVGDGADAETLRGASRLAESCPAPLTLPFVSEDWATCGAGDATELSRPPTWMVIFLDELGVSDPCPTLSLIFGCDGSETAACAFLSWP